MFEISAASPGPGGCTHEHLKTLLDDTDTTELLFEAITSLARANARQYMGSFEKECAPFQ